MATTDKKRVTLFIDSGLLKHAKVQAIAREMSLAALVEEVLTKYLPKETVTKSIEPDKRGSGSGK